MQQDLHRKPDSSGVMLFKYFKVLQGKVQDDKMCGHYECESYRSLVQGHGVWTIYSCPHTTLSDVFLTNL